jgi:hypothetical protein
MGGLDNLASGSRASVIGGGDNMATNTDTAIIGGSNNVANANFAVIYGGFTNTCSAQDAVVVGGEGNDSLGTRAGVVAGINNTASSTNSFIGGGSGVSARGANAAVIGGRGSVAEGWGSVILGGMDNTVLGDSNSKREEPTSSAEVGKDGLAQRVKTVDDLAPGSPRGAGAVILGGEGNIAEGKNSVILGGERNAASGRNSLAMGRNAKALHEGSLVWASGLEEGEFASSRPGEFAAQALGGAVFATAPPMDGKRAGSGIRLNPGEGAWTALCDRDSKENFAPVDSREVLERVAAMPIATWNWKAQDSRVKHLGPTAQDFSAAFGLGRRRQRHYNHRRRRRGAGGHSRALRSPSGKGRPHREARIGKRRTRKPARSSGGAGRNSCQPIRQQLTHRRHLQGDFPDDTETTLRALGRAGSRGCSARASRSDQRER